MATHESQSFEPEDLENRKVDQALGEPVDYDIDQDAVPGENPYDAVIAAVSSSLVAPAAVPEKLVERLEAMATGGVVGANRLKAGEMRLVGSAVSQPASGGAWKGMAITGWAAAAIAASVAIWLNVRPPAVPVSPGTGGSPVASAADPARERQALLSDPSAQLVKADWSAGNLPEQVAGDVVWSDRDQRGYIRLANLPVNNPAEYQYQLWIFDPVRGDKFPVDAGVFDSRGPGEQVIAMQPKLKVHGAAMFAITREPPGGVVVSDRSKVVALAKPL
jgi:hypothetical protein